MAAVSIGSPVYADGLATATFSSASATAGNTLVCPVYIAQGASTLTALSTPSGWTLAEVPAALAASGGYGSTCGIFYKTASAGVNTCVVTFPNGSYAVGNVVEIPPCTLGNHTHNGVSSGATSGNPGSASNTATGAFAFGVICPDNGINTTGLTPIPPTGWTDICSTSSNAVHSCGLAAYLQISGTGSQSFTESWTNSGPYMGAIAIFELVEGGSTTNKTLTATVTTSAVKVAAAKAIKSASTTMTAAKTLQARAVRSASSTVTATAARSISAIRSATTATAATAVRLVQAIRSATTTTSATLASIKTKLLTLTATVTSSATIQRAVGAIRSASSTTSAATVKTVNAIRAATSTTTATLTAIKTKLLTLSASVTTSASRILAVQAIRSATTTTAASVIKGVRAIRAATSTTTAVAQKLVSATKSATLTCTATLATIKAKLLTLTASVSTSATVSRAVSVIRSASTACNASLQKKVNLIRSASVTCTAAIASAKAKLLTLTASVTTSASMVRTTMAILSATVTTSAATVKFIRATRTATVGVLAFLTAIAHRLQALAGILWKADTRPAAALIDARPAHVTVDTRPTNWVVERGDDMGQVLDKRTRDARIYDIDCSALLSSGETISSVTSVTADQGALTFGSPSVNGSPVTYPDGHTAAAGKVIQVQISAGTLPSGQPALQCTVRALFATSVSPAVEATMLLRLIDTPNM